MIKTSSRREAQSDGARRVTGDLVRIYLREIGRCRCSPPRTK